MVLPSADLKSLALQQLETDESFEPVLDYVLRNDWVEKNEENLKLTELGQQWLEKQSSSLDVEQEVAGFGDVAPKKPYDVVKLKMETKYLSVFQALRKIEKKEIVLNPDFQRAFVWDVARQSQLIESILIRIPLPAFYIDATDHIKWNVVDGLQRLTTLFRFCREQAFPLTGLHFLTELEGKRFDDLRPEYKVLIEDETQLLFYNLMPGTPIEAKFTIFSRVNTGGLQLTPQEIRHALSQGKITALLAKIARSQEFRTSTEGVVESLRMSDRELILRALAFMHLGVGKYREFNGLDAFLLHAMDQLNRENEDSLSQLESDFYKSLSKVRAIFGRYSFRKFYEPNGRRSPLNKALFEVWTVCVRKFEERELIENKQKIISEFIELVNPYSRSSHNFVRAISASTGSSSAVITRFTTIEDLLDKVVNHD